jgi:sulfide:quinone oxidoreductase
MNQKQVTFDLGPIYKKKGITYIQARADSIHPEGSMSAANPFVTVTHTSESKMGEEEIITYDYLINATGPKLKFEATEGLGPEKNSLSVCTYGHATQTSQYLDQEVERMKKGERRNFLVGTGHGT